MTLNTLTAIALFLSGLAMAMRQITLSPDHESFPRAPWLVRTAMFTLAAAMFAGAIMFRGAPAGVDYAGAAALPVMVFACLTASFNLVMLANVARQRYRPEVWRRLHRAHRVVRDSCIEPAGRRQPAPAHLRQAARR